MSKFEFKIDNEDIMEYLNKLEELVNDKSNIRNFLKDTGYELHEDYILPLMPDWNPNLLNSPMEARNQIIDFEKGNQSLTLIYTGKTYEEETTGLDNVFWEFAVNWNPHSRHIRRDYAFFQETGIDSIVDPKVYQPSHLHFVKHGTENYEPIFQERSAEYIDRLLHLQRWERKNAPLFVYDYE